MSCSLITKGISKTREDLIQEHQSTPSHSLPLAFQHFNPLKFSPVQLSDIDMFTPCSLSVLYAKSITFPNILDNKVSTIIEDSNGDAVRLILSTPVLVLKGTMLAIFEPMLVLRDSTSSIEITDEKCICVFTDEQEFRNAGWGQKMPPGFTAEHYLSQGQTLLGKKQFKEALRKFSIALNNDPDNLEVISGLVSCYFSLGDCDNVLALSKRGLDLNPNHVNLVKMRAKCLVESNRIQEAKFLVENTKANDIDIGLVLESNNNKKINKCNRTRLSRLKELVLVEWPKLVSIEKIKKKLFDEGIHADRVSIRGKTAILIYDSVEKREDARKKLLNLEDSEFMLANEPALYE